MLGWKLMRESEFSVREQLFSVREQALQAEIDRLKDYAAKCERLIEHERERIDAERERADRTIDGYLQQAGLPAVTTTVRTEHEQEAALAADKQKSYLAQLSEIYGETLADMDAEQPEPELGATIA